MSEGATASAEATRASAGPLQGVSAAILAGGLGTRLRSVVADRPKPLALVGGRPFLAILLDQVAAYGVRHAVLCTGYRGELVRAAFGASYRDMRLEYSQEPAPLGTGGAIRLAASRLDSATVLVMNGDSYCDAPLDGFLAWHRTIGSTATILLRWVEDSRRFGRVAVDEAGTIRGFEEKGATQDAGWINAGIYLMERDRILAIPADRPVSLEREVFPDWMAPGLRGWRSPGGLLDIGTPEAYAEAGAVLRGWGVGVAVEERA